MFRKIHAVLLAAIMVISAIAITVGSAFAAEASTFTLEATSTSNAFPTKTSTYNDITTYADDNGDIYVTVDYSICAPGKQIINFQINKIEWDPNVLQFDSAVNTVKIGRNSLLNIHPIITYQSLGSITNLDYVNQGYIVSNFSNISATNHAYAYNVDDNNNPIPDTIVKVIFKVIDPTVTKTTVNLDMYILSLDDETAAEPCARYRVVDDGFVDPEYNDIIDVDTQLSPEGDVTDEPITEPVTDEPATEPMTDEPVTEPATAGPATEDEVTTDPVQDPTVEPEPQTEPPTDPVTEPVTEPATEAHVHTGGAPVTENFHAASCTQDGSYDEVIYCTDCHEEMTRSTKTIPAGHNAKFVPEVSATENAEGAKAHYICETCNNLFSDEDCKHPVTMTDLIIPKLQPATDAPTEPPTELVTEPTTEAVTETPTELTTEAPTEASPIETTTTANTTTNTDTTTPEKGEPSTDATSANGKTSSTVDESSNNSGTGGKTGSYNNTDSGTFSNGAVQTGQSTAAVSILAILIVLSAAAIFVIRSRKSDNN